MTIQELRKIFSDFSDKHGIETPLPKTFEIDHETYANVVIELIRYSIEHGIALELNENIFNIPMKVGPNRGLYFKGVELILREI